MAEAKDVVGAALVVGGGIAGVQASLDLAESGYKVYLVESQTGIGGRMAQLDKTFPTNDCSTCIFSPKLVTVGQNPNIELLSYSEVEDIQGEEGRFQVKIRQKSRHIRKDRCKACGDCATACPVHVPNEFDQKLSKRAATYRLFPPDHSPDLRHRQIRPRSLRNGVPGPYQRSRVCGAHQQRQIQRSSRANIQKSPPPRRAGPRLSPPLRKSLP